MLKERSDTNLTPTQANNGEHGRQQFGTQLLIAAIFEHFFPVLGIAGCGFRSLEEGAKVSYEATRGKKGMQAENVSPV
jgi:hypothetical protein